MSWREWTYEEWNRRLIDYCLRATGSALCERIERIPATPEELVLVTGDTNASPADVAAAFSATVTAKVPPRGKTFWSFCQAYAGWSPASDSYPHFFGMLWFTCLVAYGYPDNAGKFTDRITRVLGKAENLQMKGDRQPCCLPPLWTDFAAWTARLAASGAPFRELLLPLELGHRTGIGHSWFLAFPHKLDRYLLARSLWAADLVGYEPPIQPVIAAMEARRDKFSKEFLKDLDQFVAACVSGTAEARSSAFWRAVRQEALSPSVAQDGGTPEKGPQAGLLLVGSADEGLRPTVCGPADWMPPAGYERHELEEPVGSFTHYITGAGGSFAGPAEDSLLHDRLLGLGHRRLVGQGILLLREQSSGFYAVVSGSEANGITTALVRNDCKAAFCCAFGGRAFDGYVPGWSEIEGCRFSTLRELPAGLEGAPQLLPTMQPPFIVPSGGIRVPGGFLHFGSFLPHVHAVGATSVVLRREGQADVECSAGSEAGDWLLPREKVPARGEVTVHATWPGPQVGESKWADVGLRFVDFVADDSYKPPCSGRFLQEACTKAEEDVEGGSHVSLGISTNDSLLSADLLELEGSSRYLGPGLGEMSLHLRPGFDWMAVGPLKAPDMLVYVGDPDHPAPPAQRWSPDKGDCRHWRKAFTNARVRTVRLADGRYVDMDQFPNVAAARVAYSRHDPGTDGAGCAATDLRSMTGPAGLAPEPHPRTIEATNALAALSVRRSGLQHQDLSDLLETLVGTDNPLAVQQLLRAWTECGLVDVVRNARSGRMLIASRRPTLVMVRRGPETEATLLGLLCTLRSERIKECLGRLRGRVQPSTVLAPNPWQPSVQRFRGPVAALEELARTAGLDPPTWLNWPSLDMVPPHFDVNTAYKALPDRDEPKSFLQNAWWDWKSLVFRRRARPESPSEVELERRTHLDGTSIYVVTAGGQTCCWTSVRNWALLFAYELKGVRPFRQDSGGTLSCDGMSPVHLPLPIARLCTLLGVAVPGPVFAGREVRSYHYSFGTRLYRLIERAEAIPAAWISQRN